MKISNKFKEVAHNAARLLGYEVIPSWRFQTLGFTTLLAELFQRNQVNCVLDVGANKGQYVQFLREFVGYEGRAISFEPVSHCYQSLIRKAELDPMWETRQLALGRENAKQKINVMKSDQFSSFLQPTHKHIDGYRNLNVVDHTEEIAVRSLDDVLPELKIDSVAANIYLKLDTQGFDMEVIAGAKNALKNICALQTEVSVLNIYEDMPSIEHVIVEMRNLEFDLVGMFPVNHDHNLRVIEYDAVFINRSRMK
ncbi:FkbM family methyltransferase [Nitrosovibrio tenuis]|uniref:Methyltransferase, FkbM family n=1 Tax=Nitrosovibrio tenuis TaxID=1233 RepID=A0A1H7FQE0_9PROT|nr:FkbM family methyltransferase [Nitrosovibrio tenuis]SEK28141.1 methyltransferase, FkbM family [Nitrosovibrio tenuis]